MHLRAPRTGSRTGTANWLTALLAGLVLLACNPAQALAGSAGILPFSSGKGVPNGAADNIASLVSTEVDIRGGYDLVLSAESDEVAVGCGESSACINKYGTENDFHHVVTGSVANAGSKRYTLVLALYKVGAGSAIRQVRDTLDRSPDSLLENIPDLVIELLTGRRPVREEEEAPQSARKESLFNDGADFGEEALDGEAEEEPREDDRKWMERDRHGRLTGGPAAEEDPLGLDEIDDLDLDLDELSAERQDQKRRSRSEREAAAREALAEEQRRKDRERQARAQDRAAREQAQLRDEERLRRQEQQRIEEERQRRREEQRRRAEQERRADEQLRAEERRREDRRRQQAEADRRERDRQKDRERRQREQDELDRAEDERRRERARFNEQRDYDERRRRDERDDQREASWDRYEQEEEEDELVLDAGVIVFVTDDEEDEEDEGIILIEADEDEEEQDYPPRLSRRDDQPTSSRRRQDYDRDYKDRREPDYDNFEDDLTLDRNDKDEFDLDDRRTERSDKKRDRPRESSNKFRGTGYGSNRSDLSRSRSQGSAKARGNKRPGGAVGGYIGYNNYYVSFLRLGAEGNIYVIPSVSLDLSVEAWMLWLREEENQRLAARVLPNFQIGASYRMSPHPVFKPFVGGDLGTVVYAQKVEVAGNEVVARTPLFAFTVQAKGGCEFELSRNFALSASVRVGVSISGDLEQDGIADIQQYVNETWSPTRAYFNLGVGARYRF